MADKDFIVKNGLITGANNVTVGSNVFNITVTGNVGISNSAATNKLSINGDVFSGNNNVSGWVNSSSGFYGTVQTATQGTIDHNSLANYVANKHIDHSAVSISNGNGITGGGDLTSTRTLSVVAANGVSVTAAGVNVLAGNSELVSNSSGIYVSSSGGVARRSDTHYIGTTAIALNRASASQSLTGITSIDGSAASATNAGYATSAGSAGSATNATYASSAGSATNAGYSTNAGYATSAGSATNGMVTTGNQTITGGFVISPYNLGTGSGTVTPNPVNGNYHYITNNGAFTFGAPSSDCAIDILVTNGGSAGTISMSGFTAPAGGGGDAYDTTNTYKFILMIRRINGTSTYAWKALQ